MTIGAQMKTLRKRKLWYEECLQEELLFNRWLILWRQRRESLKTKYPQPQRAKRMAHSRGQRRESLKTTYPQPQRAKRMAHSRRQRRESLKTTYSQPHVVPQQIAPRKQRKNINSHTQPHRVPPQKALQKQSQKKPRSRRNSSPKCIYDESQPDKTPGKKKEKGCLWRLTLCSLDSQACATATHGDLPWQSRPTPWIVFSSRDFILQRMEPCTADSRALLLPASNFQSLFFLNIYNQIIRSGCFFESLPLLTNGRNHSFYNADPRRTHPLSPLHCRPCNPYL